MTNKNLKRVLIGSPSDQKPSILCKFLSSLKRLTCNRMKLEFVFIDDNQNPQSSQSSLDFKEEMKKVRIFTSEQCDDYVCDDVTHHWNERLIWKVAEFKNKIIRLAIEDQYDYLFLTDSDLLFYPELIDHLIKANKDIISEIFWTKWQPHAAPLPQVWLLDEYKQWNQSRGELLTNEEITIRTQEFIMQLKTPGIHEVGGLGACTLISRKALESGVNFHPISNLSFWGEDRHFCIRAVVLGFKLYVDTHFPAYHMYRKSDLKDAEEFITKTQVLNESSKNNHLLFKWIALN